MSSTDNRARTYRKPGMTDALAIQLRVVKGLALRDLAGQFGKRGTGIVFTFVTPMMQSAIIALMRLVAGAPGYGGMEIFPFTVCGVLYFRAFSLMNMALVDSLNQNRGLLYFHHVTELDIYLGKFVTQLTINLTVALVIYVAMRMAGVAPPADEPFFLLLLLIAANVFGFGFGLVIASLSLIVPKLQSLNRILNRILYFTSGIFFAVPEVPPAIREYLLYNPLLSMTEWSRSFYFLQYQTVYGNLYYFAEFLVVFVVLGLLLERLLRDRLVR